MVKKQQLQEKEKEINDSIMEELNSQVKEGAESES